MSRPAVVVVGAGLVGSAVAWELASRGAAVSVYDAREPGFGATQASAGMLAPYTEVRASGPFESLCIEGLDAYDDFVLRLRRDTDAAFEYTRCGSLELALDDDARTHLQHEHARVSAWPAAGAEWLEPAAVALRQPGLSAAVRGGLLLTGQGRIAPADFTAAMVAAARRAGATVTAGAPVSRLARLGSGYEIHAGGTAVRADIVVMAAGSWVGRIDVGDPPAPGVRPIRGQVLLLRPRVPVTARILWGPRCYLVPRADGCLLVGATVEDVGFDESTTVAGLSGLMQAAIELVPALADAALVEVRAGLRPVTRDELPVIGARAAEPGLVYAAGHYRNGALLAPITARIVADAVLDGRRHPALEALGPDRPNALTPARRSAMPRLTDADIAERLNAIPQWTREGDRIHREFTCPTFADAVAFIVRVGFAAEAADHHPDIAVHYRRVTLTFWTHSEGGLTAKDFAGAAAADAVAPR